MGLGLYFAEGEGPRFARTAARRGGDRGARRSRHGEALATCSTRCATIKRALAGRVPLIGFSGSPFTLACYMIEGGGSDDFATVRRMAYARPDLLQRLVDVNAQAVAAYLNEQIAAGADAVMIFDTWGGMLSAAAYRRFSLASMRAVLRGARCRRRTAARCRRSSSPRAAGTWLDEIAAMRRVARGPRLDRRHRRRAPPRRRPRRAAGQSRPAGAADRSGHRRARSDRDRAARQARPRATSSISATASSRRRRPSTSRRWSMPSIANRGRCSRRRAGWRQSRLMRILLTPGLDKRRGNGFAGRTYAHADVKSSG